MTTKVLNVLEFSSILSSFERKKKRENKRCWRKSVDGRAADIFRTTLITKVNQLTKVNKVTTPSRWISTWGGLSVSKVDGSFWRLRDSHQGARTSKYPKSYRSMISSEKKNLRQKVRRCDTNLYCNKSPYFLRYTLKYSVFIKIP